MRVIWTSWAHIWRLRSLFLGTGYDTMWLPQIPAWMSCKMAHPSSGVMHFIRVPLALHRKSSSFNRVYCPAWWCNHSHSTLSSSKPPILRYIMNGVHQSEWISMTSGDLDVLWLGSGTSWEDSATLLALSRALEMLGSWSSYKKTPVGTIARLEPSLDNSSATSFSLTKHVGTRDRQNCFLTCRAPGSIATIMTALCWSGWWWAMSPRELWVGGCRVS
jgi:hypothetical protein